jgi:hypothetical protein
MSTLNPAEQLAAAIARAELAEQARDSAYLAHNLTRQRLDAALQEIERWKGMPTCINPDHTKAPYSQGDPAHHEVTGRPTCPHCKRSFDYHMTVFCDSWELAASIERSRAKPVVPSMAAVKYTIWRTSRPTVDSGHSPDGGVCPGQGNDQDAGNAKPDGS